LREQNGGWWSSLDDHGRIARRAKLSSSFVGHPINHRISAFYEFFFDWQRGELLEPSELADTDENRGKPETGASGGIGAVVCRSPSDGAAAGWVARQAYFQ
jgi:hypothetical protein